MVEVRLLPREAVVTSLTLVAAAVLGILAGYEAGVAIVAPMALMGALLIFIRPVLGLFLLAATIPVEAALMIQGRSAAALVGVLVFAVWGAQKLLRRERLVALITPLPILAGLLLFGMACLSIVWAVHPNVMQRPLVLLAQLLLLAILVADLASSFERLAWVAKLLVLAATVAAALTAEQYFLGGVRRAGEGVVGGVNRTASTLVTIVPFAFFLVRSNQTRAWQFLGATYIGLAGVAVAATLSRMNFLLFPLVVFLNLALMTRTKGGRTRVLLLAVATIVAMYLTPMEAVQQRAETIAPHLTQTFQDEEVGELTQRGYHLRVSLALFRDNPIIGAGYYNYGSEYLAYQWEIPGTPRLRTTPQSPHNSHFAFLANLGVIGFLLWMCIFAGAAVCVARAWSAARGSGREDLMALVEAVGIGLGLLFVYGFYGEVHQDKIFWIVIGLAVATRVVVGDGQPDGEGTPPLGEGGRTVTGASR